MPTDEATAAPEAKTARVLLAAFAGLRFHEPIAGSPELHAVWYELDGDGSPTDKRLSFAVGKKPHTLTGKGVLIGDVFEMDDDNGTFGTTRSRRQPRKEQHPKWREWHAEEHAALSAKKAYKAAKETDIGGLTLDELKKLYRKQIGRNTRTAFLLQVHQYMTG